MSHYNPDQYTEPQAGLEPNTKPRVVVRVAVYAKQGVNLSQDEADDIQSDIDRLLHQLPHVEKLVWLHE